MGRDHSSVAHPAYTVQLINHGSQAYLSDEENVEPSYILCLVSHVASCVSVNRFIVAQLPTDPFVYMAGNLKVTLFRQELTNTDTVYSKDIYVDMLYNQCLNEMFASKLDKLVFIGNIPSIIMTKVGMF